MSMNNPSGLPISENLLTVWQNLATALSANTINVSELESAVHAISTISPTNKKLMEEIIAMMPQPWISPLLMTQIFSNPETAIGALSRLGSSNSTAAAAFFGSVESAIVLSAVISWMQSQQKEAQLAKDLIAHSSAQNPINEALKAYILNKGATTAAPTAQSLQYLRDNPILLATLKTASPELLIQAFQIAESQIILSCLDQMIESQAKIREAMIQAEKKKEATTPSPGQAMLNGYLHDIKNGKMDLSQSVMMVMQFLLIAASSAAPISAIAQGNTISPTHVHQISSTGESGGIVDTQAANPTSASQTSTGVSGGITGTDQTIAGGVMGAQVAVATASMQPGLSKLTAGDEIPISQPAPLGQSGGSSEIGMVTDTGQVVSISHTATIANAVATASAGLALGFVPINDISKSWETAFPTVTTEPGNQIAQSKDIQEQLGLLASVYSQMAPYWSIPAAVSFITLAGGVTEKTVPEAAVRAYAASIGTLVMHPDFSLLVRNLILRNVKDPEKMSQELLTKYTAALKITLLVNALVTIHLTTLRKTEGHFSAQELYDIIVGKAPLPPNDDLFAGLVKLIQEELKNLPQENQEAFLMGLLSSYSDSSDIETLMDPSKQFLTLCDQSFAQNKTASEAI